MFASATDQARVDWVKSIAAGMKSSKQRYRVVERKIVTRTQYLDTVIDGEKDSAPKPARRRKPKATQTAAPSTEGGDGEANRTGNPTE